MFFMKKIKDRKLVLSIFILALIFFTINQIQNYPEDDDLKTSHENRDNIKIPNFSDFWDEEDLQFIHILNDNWSAIELDWIQNNTGSWDDPHIIENVTINAGENGIGILIEDSNQHFIIQNCTIYNSTEGNFDTAAIYLKNADNGTIIENSLSYNNGSGLILENAINITISQNFITNNKEDGIFIIGQSRNNTFLENDIVNNTIKGMDFNDTSNWNVIFKNNFTNNGINAMDNGTNNSWYNDTTGNYWDDYTGCDSDNDGIGQTPYEVPGEVGARDLYPICYTKCSRSTIVVEAEDADDPEDQGDPTVQFMLQNIGSIAIVIILVEVVLGIMIFINKRRESRFIDGDDFWSEKS
ncbi:MAG: hypothetical protein EU539_05590 [Promethearchaeota archaeon]|nr:MAG: hypothetical protein EU539_05590 [Candidatus Lokiarchaeota archaeon]